VAQAGRRRATTSHADRSGNRHPRTGGLEQHIEPNHRRRQRIRLMLSHQEVHPLMQSRSKAP
jgi:hypothetical protein